MKCSSCCSSHVRHSHTLPTTLKQALLLPDPVYKAETCLSLKRYRWVRKKKHMGGPQNPGSYLWKIVIYSYTFKFNHLQSTLHLMQYTYQDFFHCSEQFLNWSILMPFSSSAVFCFTSSTSAKCFPLRTFFFQGNKKSHLGQDWVNREGRAWGSCNFWSKTTEHSERYAYKSPIKKWANMWKESSKNFTEIELSLSQQGQLAQWCRWDATTLTHLAGEACITKGLPSMR